MLLSRARVYMSQWWFNFLKSEPAITWEMLETMEAILARATVIIAEPGARLPPHRSAPDVASPAPEESP